MERSKQPKLRSRALNAKAGRAVRRWNATSALRWPPADSPPLDVRGAPVVSLTTGGTVCGGAGRRRRGRTEARRRVVDEPLRDVVAVVDARRPRVLGREAVAHAYDGEVEGREEGEERVLAARCSAFPRAAAEGKEGVPRFLRFLACIDAALSAKERAVFQ